MNDPYNFNSFPKNQNEAVLAYMHKYGGIDFLTAAQSCGVSQLTARIAELRHKGWTFDKRTETGKNRFGNTFQKVIYSNARLEIEPQAEMRI